MRSDTLQYFRKHCEAVSDCTLKSSKKTVKNHCTRLSRQRAAEETPHSAESNFKGQRYSQYFVPVSVPSAQAVFPSPLLTRIQDICQVTSTGSFRPAHSTNIQFEGKSAHKALNYNILFWQYPLHYKHFPWRQLCKLPTLPTSTDSRNWCRLRRSWSRGQRVCAVPDCGQIKPQPDSELLFKL